MKNNLTTIIDLRDHDGRFTLPPLPYTLDALEPHISATTLTFHHGKHLAAYINNMNNLLADSPLRDLPLRDIVLQSEGAIFNNAAQALNHLFYFEALRPATPDPNLPDGPLADLIARDFGSFPAFRDQLSSAANTLFGSGWAWLSLDPDGHLRVEQTSNADTPLRHGRQPLLTIDVWEHAYYLDTRNDRAQYVANLWPLIDWSVVSRRLTSR